MLCESSYKIKQGCERMKEEGIKGHLDVVGLRSVQRCMLFLSGDISHPQLQKIYMELERLSQEMKFAGYVLDARFVLKDVKEEEKEHILCQWDS